DCACDAVDSVAHSALSSAMTTGRSFDMALSQGMPARSSIGSRFGRSTHAHRAMRFCVLFRTQAHGPITSIIGDNDALGWSGRGAAFASSVVYAACREREIQGGCPEGPRRHD